jgi:predicted MPP superfamily phosphohydrolase
MSTTSLKALQSLTAAEIRGKSLYVIGDIHGCYDELIQLEEIIKAHAIKKKQQPLIICVGDYCDRGPKSKEVIQHVADGVAAGTHIAILGNHEWYFLLVNATSRREELQESGISWPNYLISDAELFENANPGTRPTSKDLSKVMKSLRERWQQNGGETTMKSYDTTLDDSDCAMHVPLKHLQFLITCPAAVETPHGIVSHAHMHREHYETLQNPNSDRVTLQKTVDQCLWNRVLPEESVHKKLWHFSGHTPHEKIKRSFKNRWIQLDTGCVYGHKLTAIHMQSRKSFSVDAKEVYKPKKL